MFSKLREYKINQLMDFIRDMCCFLAKDKETKGEKLPNDENRIRTILLEEYIKKGTGMEDCIFLPEMCTNYIGNGVYKGRTDLYVIFKTDYDYHQPDAFFIAECKRVDGKKTLNKLYVKEGIDRFTAVNPKYSTYYGISMMVGFVVKPISIRKNAHKIEDIQNSSADQSMHGLWIFKDKKGKTERFECAYHNRPKPISLQHLFADFSKIM